MDIQEKIQEYERRLHSMQTDLDNLKKEALVHNDFNEQVIIEKLGSLQREVENMNRELYLLKKKVSAQTSPDQRIMSGQSVPSQSVPGQSVPSQSMPGQSMLRHPMANQSMSNQTIPTKQKKDIEKTIGKSWMAVFASLLIFISIVMFAALWIPNLSDTAKIGIMFVVSIAITALGTVETVRNASNKLWISIAGCGAGALYLSFLLTNVYFHLLGTIPLFVLVLLWSVGVCYLAKYQTVVFQIIGQLGIFISIILGMVSSVSDQKDVQLMVVVGFYFLTQIFYFVMHWKKEYEKNIVSHAGVLGNAIVLVIGGIMLSQASVLVSVLIFLFCYTLVGMFLMDCQNSIDWYRGIFYIPTLILLFVIDGNLISFVGKEPPLYFSFVYLEICAILIVLKIRKMGERNEKIMEIATMVGLSFYATCISDSFLAVGVISLLCLGAAFVCNDAVYRTGGEVLGIIFLIGEIVLGKVHLTETFLAICFLTVCILAISVLMIKYRNQNGMKKLTVLTFYVFIIFIATNLEMLQHDELDVGTYFMVIAICNMLLLKLPCMSAWRTGEDNVGYEKFLQICNSVLVVCALYVINNATILLVPVILIALALYSINVKQLLDHQKLIVNLYVGLKYTVLLICILYRLNVTGIITSICCLLLSVVSIAIGSVIAKKALRVYGLILSNLCFIKLLLIDIDYQNLTERAAGFFICGILCFVISFLYHHQEQKMKDKS